MASITQSLRRAKETGHLQLSNRGLSDFPEEATRLETVLTEEEKWWEVVPLKTIDISYNKISSIPETIGNLKDLVSFKAIDNCLSLIPDQFCFLESLKLVDLSRNDIHQLPSAIGALPCLVQLNISNNRLQSLPDSLAEVAVLEELNVSSNQLAGLPLRIGNLSRLRVLNASNNTISDLPESIGQLEELQVLHLASNLLETLPPQLENLTSLKELDCRLNRIQKCDSLPFGNELHTVLLGNNSLRSCDSVQWHNSPSLAVIDLSNNKLSSVPNGIESLSLLNSLDISNNDISDLPYILGFMKELRHISVDGNPLRTIRRTILSSGVSSLKKYLQTRAPQEALEHVESEFSRVNLGPSFNVFEREAKSSGVLQLSEAIRQDIDTEELIYGLSEEIKSIDLSRNSLCVLPSAINYCTTLEILRAENNLLQQLPSFSNLRTLLEIHLRQNQLVSVVVDRAIQEIVEQLQTIDLRNNALEWVPHCIQNAQRLHTLLLGYNQIVECNIDFGSNLRTLDLSNNRIENFPTVVLNSRTITSLDLENNNISSLPPELGNCTQLTLLKLYGNPQRLVRHHILQQGTPAILTYLRNRIDPETSKSHISTSSVESLDMSRILEMEREINELEDQLEDHGITQAKKYAIKKKIAVQRAAIIRERRKMD